MTSPTTAADRSHSPIGVIALLLMAIFDTELAVRELISFITDRLDAVTAGLLTAALFSLLYALPLWLLIRQLLGGGGSSHSPDVRTALPVLFSKALAIVFLGEFLGMMVLPAMLPPSQTHHIRTLLEIFLSMAICLPLLWYLLARAGKGLRDAGLREQLADPARLFILLLFLVFLVEFLQEEIFNLVPALLQSEFLKLIDSSVTTMIIAPFLWWFVARPLKAAGQAEKALATAVQSQVVDAVVGVDTEGKIGTFNPAAEGIFGYTAEEMIGRDVSLLFADDQQGMAELLRRGEQLANGDNPALTRELTGRRKDGAAVCMNVSLSRVKLGGVKQFLLIMRDISERVKMEQALRASEERFELAVNGANDGIWDWDVRTGRVFYSPRLRDLLGYREGELESNFETFRSLLHPDDHDRIVENILSHLERRTPYDVELRLRTNRGDFRWFRVRGQAMWDESGKAERMAGSISDITMNKEAEDALRDSETRFREVFEQSEDAIVFFKPGSTTLIDANKTTEKLYGFTRDELKERGIACFCREGESARFGRFIRDIRGDKMANLDSVTHVRKDGSEIIVSVRGKVINIQGVEIVYCTFRDITERVHMEEEAQKIQARLIQANKMTSLGLLVSGVAHEINNPNNFILANSQLLDAAWQDALRVLREYYRENGDFQIGGIPFSDFDQKSQHLFAGITDGSRRINEIVNNLKDYVRADRPQVEQEIDINKVVTAAVNILHYELIKHTDRFHLDLGENIPGVRGSSQQLVQVVTNLVMNACQAISDKERGIWVTTGYDEVAGQVTITVRDEGRGIPEPISGRVMEPFFTTKLDSGGTGLGLFINQSIIKEHGGSFEFTSEPGRGTTFIVKIPAARAAAQENSP